jgi:hypothetical protein
MNGATLGCMNVADRGGEILAHRQVGRHGGVEQRLRAVSCAALRSSIAPS